jgi:poly(A) polymerase
MELLLQSDLLEIILPEATALKGVLQPPQFHPEGDVWEHVLRMLDLLTGDYGPEGDLRLAWAVLLHDVGKPATRFADERGVHFYGHVQKSEHMAEVILTRLKFSQAETTSILALIRHHMRFMTVKDMRPNRLKRFLRMADFPLHLELHRLDCLGSHGLLDHYEFCRDQLAVLTPEELQPPRLLSGDDLRQMGFTPGPVFKEIFAFLETEQLERRVETPEEARQVVLAHWRPR